MLTNPEPLLLQMEDSWPPIRLVAGEQLGQGVFPNEYHGVIAHSLLTCLKLPDEDHRVRRAALESLPPYEGSHEDIVSTVIDILSDDDVQLAISCAQTLPHLGVSEEQIVSGLVEFIAKSDARAVFGLILAAGECCQGSSTIADLIIENIPRNNEISTVLISALPSIAPRSKHFEYAAKLESLLPLPQESHNTLALSAIRCLRGEVTCEVDSSELSHSFFEVKNQSFCRDPNALADLLEDLFWRGVPGTIAEAFDHQMVSVGKLIRALLSVGSQFELECNVSGIEEFLLGDATDENKSEVVEALMFCERLALPCLNVVRQLRHHSDPDLRQSARMAHDIISTSYVREKVES